MPMLIPIAWVVAGMSVPLSGTVVDQGGRPVEGATVWLGDTFATHQGPEVLATAETDGRGRFRLERADGLAGRGGYWWSPTLWAYKPGSRLAFLEFKRSLPGADEPVRLELGPPAETAFRVVGPDGTPSKGARVRLVQANFKAPRPPDKLLDRLAATTDDGGRATIDGVRPEDVLALDVTVEGQVVQTLPIEPDTGTVTLRPLGRLKARIVADDPAALRGWTITATSSPAEPGYRGPATHWVRERTGEDGRVEFPPVADGNIAWKIVPPEGSSYVVVKQPTVAVRPGETTEAELTVGKGIRVEGVVRSEPGGEPVAGVKVDVNSLQAPSSGVRRLVTDARGRYSAVILPGKARFTFQIHDMPKDYFLPPGVQHWVDFEVNEGAETQEFNPPALRKAAQVRGRVLDEAGKPAPVVGVTGYWTSAEFGRQPDAVRTNTDARGEFVLGSIAPRAEVRVSATAGWVIKSDEVIVAGAGEGEPIELRLRKQPSLALSGRVLDADGRPLPGAQVQVVYRPRNQPGSPPGSYMNGGWDEIRTGRDGRYKTPDMLPIDYEYRVEAEAKGYDPVRSAWLKDRAADVPDVALRRSVRIRELSGRVVDSSGKPVAGAEVFQSGDGPKRTRGMTDADGRFRVPAVPDAPVLLFVSREGFRFDGRRVDAGDRPVEFALRRTDEPPAERLRPAGPAVPRDEERAIARALVAGAGKAPGGTYAMHGPQQRDDVTALLEPDRAITMIENQVVPAGSDLLRSIVIRLAEDDPRRAVELIGSVADSSTASSVALGLFDRLGSTAPAGFRRDLLALSERRAREIKGPGPRVMHLARLADRWLELGEAGRGEGLVQEARAAAKEARRDDGNRADGVRVTPRGAGQPPDYPGDDVVLALARVDLPAALKILGVGDARPYLPGALTSRMAARIAASDPAGALRVLGLIPGRTRQPARRDVCLRMATTDLAAARALAAEDRDPIVQALLPAMAARGRAASDPEGARALLRESVEALGALADRPSTSGPPTAVVIARLLPLAARIDPDGAPGYFWLALSRRPPLSARPEPLPVTIETRQHYLDLAELAVLAARYDRPAAEVVFAPVAARLVGLDDEYWGMGNEGPAIFQAAGAFDARIARALLEALPADPAPPRAGISGFQHHSKAKARFTLAVTLALPPKLRLRKLYRPGGGVDWLDVLDE